MTNQLVKAFQLVKIWATILHTHARTPKCELGLGKPPAKDAAPKRATPNYFDRVRAAFSTVGAQVVRDDGHFESEGNESSNGPVPMTTR